MMRRRVSVLAILMLLTCGPAKKQQAVAQEPQRLVVIEYTQLTSSGFDWVSVWLVRDTQTNNEFLITRTPESTHSLQIRTEPQP